MSMYDRLRTKVARREMVWIGFQPFSRRLIERALNETESKTLTNREMTACEMAFLVLLSRELGVDTSEAIKHSQNPNPKGMETASNASKTNEAPQVESMETP